MVQEVEVSWVAVVCQEVLEGVVYQVASVAVVYREELEVEEMRVAVVV